MLHHAAKSFIFDMFADNAVLPNLYELIELIANFHQLVVSQAVERLVGNDMSRRFFYIFFPQELVFVKACSPPPRSAFLFTDDL